MLGEALLRYLHFFSLFILFSSVVAEHLLLAPTLPRKTIKRLSIIDGIYGASAILAVIAGLLLWFKVGKPAHFYSQNGLFHLKVGLAILLGLLSIYPTVFFIKHRKGESDTEEIEIPNLVKWMIRLELILLVFIPLLATLMARGYGYFGGDN